MIHEFGVTDIAFKVNMSEFLSAVGVNVGDLSDVRYLIKDKCEGEVLITKTLNDDITLNTDDSSLSIVFTDYDFTVLKEGARYTNVFVIKTPTMTNFIPLSFVGTENFANTLHITHSCYF